MQYDPSGYLILPFPSIKQTLFLFKTSPSQIIPFPNSTATFNTSLKNCYSAFSPLSSTKVILPCLPYLLSSIFQFNLGRPLIHLPFNDRCFQPKQSSPQPSALLSSILPLYKNLLGHMILPCPLATPSTIYPQQQNLQGAKITPFPVLAQLFFQLPYMYSLLCVFSQAPEVTSFF